jgi:hypothetical protein
MKPLDSLTHFATVRLRTEDAGQEPAPAGAASIVVPSPRPEGWDPFEVWRTRVRDARSGANRPAGG